MTDGPPPLVVPPLDCDGFRLRALTVADAPELYAQVVGDDEIRRWSSIGRVTDLESTRRWAAARATPERVEWTIRHLDGSLAGRIALHRVDPHQGTGEIGYGLFRAHRGRGLARRAVDRVTAYGFDDFGLRRIELEHAVDNHRSCGVAMACGYALEGTRRQALEDHLGGWEDAHLHARLSSD